MGLSGFEFGAPFLPGSPVSAAVKWKYVATSVVLELPSFHWVVRGASANLKGTRTFQSLQSGQCGASPFNLSALA